MSDCERCEKPVADTGYVCHPCTEQLGKALEFVSENAGELDTVITRQAKGSTLVGGRSAETPLPYQPEASEASDTIRNTLSTWCRAVIDDRGLDYPANTLPAMAEFLRGQLGWLRCQPFAGQAFDELDYSCWLLRVTVDTRPELSLLGPCQTISAEGICAQELRAVAGAAWVRCPTCGTSHDTSARKKWLLQLAHNRLETFSSIIRILARWSAGPVPEGTVKSWIHRGRLARRGVDSQGSPLYQVGEAIDLAIRSEQRKAKAA